jgi:hypothetical protein
VLFHAKDVPVLGKIVISRNGVGLALNETINFRLQVVEVFVRPTKFHLCINHPYSQRHSEMVAGHLLEARDNYLNNFFSPFIRDPQDVSWQ